MRECRPSFPRGDTIELRGIPVGGSALCTPDWIVVVSVTAVNLLMAALFLCRRQGLAHCESRLGLLIIGLGIPIAVAVGWNLRMGADVWRVVLPLPLLLFLLVEWILDYLLKVPFRTTRLIGPYLLLLFLGLFGAIGYAFRAARPAGFACLVSYFVNLAAMLWAHFEQRLH